MCPWCGATLSLSRHASETRRKAFFHATSLQIALLSVAQAAVRLLSLPSPGDRRQTPPPTGRSLAAPQAPETTLQGRWAPAPAEGATAPAHRTRPGSPTRRTSASTCTTCPRSSTGRSPASSATLRARRVVVGAPVLPSRSLRTPELAPCRTSSAVAASRRASRHTPRSSSHRIRDGGAGEDVVLSASAGASGARLPARESVQDSGPRGESAALHSPLRHPCAWPPQRDDARCCWACLGVRRTRGRCKL